MGAEAVPQLFDRRGQQRREVDRPEASAGSAVRARDVDQRHDLLVELSAPVGQAREQVFTGAVVELAPCSLERDGVTEDRGERGPELMGHGGEEVGLQPL